jgi:hypothetical protein
VIMAKDGEVALSFQPLWAWITVPATFGHSE